LAKSVKRTLGLTIAILHGILAELMVALLLRWAAARGCLRSMTKQVLIVDDNEHLRQMLASMLRLSGYEVSEAATGTQAIERAVLAKPNLILMDIDLPDITGADAALAIRKDPRTTHIPIVGLSAHLGWEFRETALRAGMVDFLVKPLDAAVIRAKIEKFILTEKEAMSHIESKLSISAKELLVSSLAQTDALAKLLIEKSIITQQEFLQKTAEERATYQRMVNPNQE
jgi:two-component system, cell cycle response regulator DivK